MLKTREIYGPEFLKEAIRLVLKEGWKASMNLLLRPSKKFSILTIPLCMPPILYHLIIDLIFKD